MKGRYRISTRYNEGVGGNTTAQILARISNVLAHNPQIVVVEGGGNDIVNAVTSTTTIANLTSIYAALQAAGVKFVTTTVCPTTSIDTQAEKDAYDAVNAWIRAHTADYSKGYLCDWDSAIRTPGAYTWLAGYDADGVHPNATGAAALAGVLGPVLATALA